MGMHPVAWWPFRQILDWRGKGGCAAEWKPKTKKRKQKKGGRGKGWKRTGVQSIAMSLLLEVSFQQPGLVQER